MSARVSVVYTYTHMILSIYMHSVAHLQFVRPPTVLFCLKQEPKGGSQPSADRDPEGPQNDLTPPAAVRCNINIVCVRATYMQALVHKPINWDLSISKYKNSYAFVDKGRYTLIFYLPVYVSIVIVCCLSSSLGCSLCMHLLIAIIIVAPAD